MAEGASLPSRLRARFLASCAAAGWLPAVYFGIEKGWLAAAAYLATFLLVCGDFYWISAGFGPLFAEGRVGRGVAKRVVTGLVLRMALLILGFYVILHLLSGGASAIATGIVVPLALLAGAGVSLYRG